MRTWQILESLFRESRQYRGDNSVRLKDLEKMLEAIIKNGKISDPNTSIDKNGGAFSCQYAFDPKIWGKWFSSQDAALTMAAGDKDVVGQYAGRSQGALTAKTNWGGRIVNLPGKARTDFERMPSAMDRYDVLMQGEITSHTKVDRKTGKNVEEQTGMLLSVAYSPSIGSMEERKARLVALMSGGSVPGLKRRVQPHVPEPKKGAEDSNAPAVPVPKVGQNLKIAADDDDGSERKRSLGGAAPSHFTSFLSKHNAEYQPQAKKKGSEEEDEVDIAMQALFPRKK